MDTRTVTFEDGKAVTYQLKYTHCNRHCRKCPHGPYWYAYWRAGGKVRCRYITKKEAARLGLGGPEKHTQPELDFSQFAPPAAAAAELPQARPIPVQVAGMTLSQAMDLLGLADIDKIPKGDKLRQKVWNLCHRKSATEQEKREWQEALEILRQWRV